mgnify:CR=1 FL=1
MGEGTILRVPPLGMIRAENRKIGSGDCVKVSFDINNIHVVVVASKILNIMKKVYGLFRESL